MNYKLVFMKICMYGSGSKKTPKEFTDVGYNLGAEIAKKGHSLVFGGGNDGMMGAVASGVFDNGGEILAIFPNWIMEFDDEFNNSSKASQLSVTAGSSFCLS